MAKRKIRYGLIRRETGEHVALCDTFEEAQIAVDQAIAGDIHAIAHGWSSDPNAKPYHYDIVEVKGRVF